MSRLGAATIAVALWAESSAAQPSSREAFRFRYEVPEACPTVAEFTARVRQRTTRGREAQADELARTFVVTIDPDATGFMGKVEFVDDEGAPAKRRVHGEECDAVVSSLALITALALDAALREDPQLAVAAFEPSRPPPATAEKPAPVAAAPPVAPPPPRSAPSRALVSNVRVGLAAGYHSLLPAAVVGLLGQIDFRGDFSLRLTAHHEAATLQVDAGRAISARILGLSTSVCALRPHWAELSFYPCLSFDVGSLRARGIGSDALPSVSSDTVPWATVGPELRVAWEPSRWWLELRGSLPFALYERRFDLQNPNNIALNVVHDVTLEGGLAAGVRFW